MRQIAVLFVAVLFAFAINAPVELDALPVRGGAVVVASCNFPPNPGFGSGTSPDGSEILAQAPGVESCTIQDKFGVIYAFVGNGYFLNGGGPFSGFSDIAIEAGGYAMFNNTCNQIGPTIWTYRDTGGEFKPAASKTALPSPLPFQLTNGATVTHYGSFQDMANSVVTGALAEVLPLQGSLPIWRGSYRIGSGQSNVTIQIDKLSNFGCTFDEGNLLPLDTSNGSLNGWTVQGQSSLAADIPTQGIGNQLGVTCVFAGNGQAQPGNQILNLTVKDLILHDCWFGFQYNTQATGSVGTMTDVILDHNGCSGQSVPCHNQYWGFMTPGNFSKFAISGHGSHCMPTDPDNASLGAFFKGRWIGGTIQNYTMSEIDPYNRGYTDCNVAWVAEAACGGNYTWGSAGTGQGIVAQAGPNFGNVFPNPNGGFDFFRVGRDLGVGQFHGYIVPGTGSNGANIGQGLLTVISVENTAPAPGQSWQINNSGGQSNMTIGQAGSDTSGNVAFNTIILSQVSGTTGGTGTYIVSISQTVASSGSPEAMSAVFNCGFYPTGYTDTACNTVFSQNCQILLQNAWVILDNTPAPEGSPGQWQSEAFLWTVEPGYTANRVTYKNNKIVMNTITPAPTGAIAANGAITGLSTNVNTLGWTVGMAVCDPTTLSSPGLGLIPFGVTISTIASNGLSATLSNSITGATGQTDTFYAGACMFPNNTTNGGIYLPGAVDGGGNQFFANRAAAGLPAYPYLPPPM